jgi:hypothetical protein
VFSRGFCFFLEKILPKLLRVTAVPVKTRNISGTIKPSGAKNISHPNKNMSM